MARPVKVRKVEKLPSQSFFIPIGKKKCEIEEIEIKIEELEAMRLKDIEELSQEECAKQMEISRQTFQNILDEGRKKLTLALIQGKAIHIAGGDFVAKECKYYCKACQTFYTIQYGIDKQQCPQCGSKEIACGRRECGCRKGCNM